MVTAWVYTFYLKNTNAVINRDTLKSKVKKRISYLFLLSQMKLWFLPYFFKTVFLYAFSHKKTF